MAMLRIASAAGAGARRGAGLRVAFLAAFFSTGFLAAGLAAAAFLAGAGIFMPGMPGMSCADAGMPSASAVVAANAASSRFMPRLRAGAR